MSYVRLGQKQPLTLGQSSLIREVDVEERAEGFFGDRNQKKKNRFTRNRQTWGSMIRPWCQIDASGASQDTPCGSIAVFGSHHSRDWSERQNLEFEAGLDPSWLRWQNNTNPTLPLQFDSPNFWFSAQTFSGKKIKQTWFHQFFRVIFKKKFAKISCYIGYNFIPIVIVISS